MHLCCCDGLPCDLFDDSLGFGLCYVKSLDGRLNSVCSRFALSDNVEFIEDLVRS